MRSMQKVAGFLVAAVVSGAVLLGTASLAVADTKRERTRSAQTLQGRSHRKGRRASHSKRKKGQLTNSVKMRHVAKVAQFKAGDKVEVSVNENNAIVDVHLEGEKRRT